MMDFMDFMDFKVWILKNFVAAEPEPGDSGESDSPRRLFVSIVHKGVGKIIIPVRATAQWLVAQFTVHRLLTHRLTVTDSQLTQSNNKMNHSLLVSYEAAPPLLKTMKRMLICRRTYAAPRSYY